MEKKQILNSAKIKLILFVSENEYINASTQHTTIFIIIHIMISTIEHVNSWTMRYINIVNNK